jgi:hypothetical protein
MLLWPSVLIVTAPMRLVSMAPASANSQSGWNRVVPISAAESSSPSRALPFVLEAAHE